MKWKGTLITNLGFVQWQNTTLPVRLNVNALLIEENNDSPFNKGKSCRIRGFGSTASHEIFQMWLEPGQETYELIRGEDTSTVMLSQTGSLKPIFRGGQIQFKDGPNFFLQLENELHDFDIKKFDDPTDCWEYLEDQVAKYATTPYKPKLIHVPNPNYETYMEGVYGEDYKSKV